jgi:nitrogen fixation NifU-like protein
MKIDLKEQEHYREKSNRPNGFMERLRRRWMTDELDDFARELQDHIYEETRRTYGQVAFERWLRPLYVGVMDNPDGYSRVTGSCGDTIEIFLKFEKDIVKDAAFQTDGCGPSTVCGSFAAELAIGKNPDDVAQITGGAILEILGGLPEEDQHCAFLAAETLQEALADYLRKQRKGVSSEQRPWEKPRAG